MLHRVFPPLCQKREGRPSLICCKWKQGDISRSFNCCGKLSLVFRAVAGDAPWQDLTALGYILSQAVVIFIIYMLYFINAETADFLLLNSFCLQTKKPPFAT